MLQTLDIVVNKSTHVTKVVFTHFLRTCIEDLKLLFNLKSLGLPGKNTCKSLGLPGKNMCKSLGLPGKNMCKSSELPGKNMRKSETSLHFEVFRGKCLAFKK